NLPVEDTIKTQMINFVPVGYAVTYIFGTIGAAFVLSTFGPKILGVNLEEESNKLDHASRVAIEDELLKSCAGEVIYRV
ncbi:aspartate-alanine antiporter, partial [Acinetobacter baumannii]